MRVARTVANDHTVSWNGERWGLASEQVRVGMRAGRGWRSKGAWMARTGCASATTTTCRCTPARRRRDPRVLEAVGRKDLRIENRNPQPTANPNTVHLPITPGGNLGGGHFYFAQNRTFLLYVDTLEQMGES